MQAPHRPLAYPPRANGSSAPGTARSGSSSTPTPRTGTTARSSALAPTPRTGLQVQTPVPSSPLTTWRSGALSSPASSQDQRVQSVRPCVYHDLLQEIEAMRFVIFQENRQIKRQLDEIWEEASHLEQTTWAPAPRRSRVVEWRIQGVNGEHGAELGISGVATFSLPEYPEVIFELCFGAGHSPATYTVSVAVPPSAPELWPCQLQLRVSGPGCANIDLSIGLAAEVEAGDASCTQTGQHGGTLLGQAEGIVLRSGGQATCPCTWPQAPGASVLCRVRVELAGLQSSFLRKSKTACAVRSSGEAPGTSGSGADACPLGGTA